MRRTLITLFILALTANATAQPPAHRSPRLVTSQTAPLSTPKWKLIWQEDFNGKKVNAKNWSVIPRGTAHWNRLMSTEADLIQIKKGNLVLTGKVKPEGVKDTAKYITGGLHSIGKFNFKYGRIDICAKLQSAKGAWPALWLLPDVEGRKWPDQGEIDIMEHLNYDDFVYQTAHSAYTVVHGIKDNPPHGGTGKIERDGYNVYSVEWTPTRIVWLINGVATFEYRKLDDKAALDKGQWPFDEPFYIILSQQLGGPGTWVGEIDDADLPVKMWIDYIKVYQNK